TGTGVVEQRIRKIEQVEKLIEWVGQIEQAEVKIEIAKQAAVEQAGVKIKVVKWARLMIEVVEQAGVKIEIVKRGRLIEVVRQNE
ncbi:20103_t:CDS:2, partial [Racocetra fulgida]